MQGKKDIVETWHNLPNTEYHIMLIYLTFMVLQVALHEIPYSDDFKASWVYFSTPIDKPGEILSGTLKAVFVRLFIPGYVGISILILAIWGIRAADDILFGFFNNAIMLLILALINKRELPFSIAPNLRSQSGNVARAFIAFLIIGILGFGHYLLSKWPSIQLGTIPVQIGLIFLLLRSYKRTGWSSITL
jgi:ABC-2 type transport system permease protein